MFITASEFLRKSKLLDDSSQNKIVDEEEIESGLFIEDHYVCAEDPDPFSEGSNLFIEDHYVCAEDHDPFGDYKFLEDEYEEQYNDDDDDGYDTQDEATGRRLERSNSQMLLDYYDDEDKVITDGIKSSQRNLVGDKKFSFDEAKDMLKIAVISQEASNNFAWRYHEKISINRGIDESELTKNKAKSKPKLSKRGKIKNPSKSNILINESKINQPFIDTFDKNIKYEKASSQATSHNEFLEQLLENKRPAHVIVVVEGEREPLVKTFLIDDTIGQKHKYKLHEDYIQGKANGRGGKLKDDAKQSMHFYIREDMEEAIKIEEVNISEYIKKAKKESKNYNESEINKMTNNFLAGKISFSTKEGEEIKNYSVLAVHIPNCFVGSEREDKETHKGFEAYAKEQLEENDETVIGYVGDTNFVTRMAEHSLPSMGGITDNKQYISHTSSSAEEDTYFMQGVALNEDNEAFAMQQPSLLNMIEANIENSKIGTDHPSFLIGTMLTGEIVGRKAKNKDAKNRKDLKRKLDEFKGKQDEDEDEEEQSGDDMEEDESEEEQDEERPTKRRK